MFNKTVCLVFSPEDRSKTVAYVFPSLKFDREEISVVNRPSFKYLRHIITSDLSKISDDDDDYYYSFGCIFFVLR